MHPRDTPRPMPEDWRKQAACRGMDPAIFYPTAGESLAPAKKVCASCPVKGECLSDNLDTFTTFNDCGVWGGQSEKARSEIRRAAGTQPKPQGNVRDHGTGAAYRKHYRDGTPVCARCSAWSVQYRAELKLRGPR